MAEVKEIDPKYFRGIGLWQLAVERNTNWWVRVNLMIGCLFLANISTQMMITLTGGYEFNIFTEKLSVNLTVMESTFKIIYYCVKRSQLFSISSCFKSDLLLCSQHDLQITATIMSSGFTLVNRVTKSFVLMIFSTVGVWNILPVLRCLLSGDCSKWNIMPSWYPHGWETTAYVYLYEFFIMVYCAALLYNVNCFFSALALSLAAQFELLTTSLASIEKNAEKKGGDKLKSMDSLLRDCLIDHQTLLKLSEEMEALYNPLFLYQMLASTFTICLVLVQINVATSSNELPMVTTCKFLMYLLFGSMELLVYSWGGQILANEVSHHVTFLANDSFCLCPARIVVADIGILIAEVDNTSLFAEEIHRSLYYSGWSEGSMWFRKNVSIAMCRTMRPVYLTAGKFYRVDLQSFTQIIKASYSYFTFLHGSDSSGR